MVKVLSIYIYGEVERINERQWSTVSSPTEVLRKDALRESDH